MTTFDFGEGHVPAHQHANGGGWVSDTAHVAETAFVGPMARVFGNARVFDTAQVSGDAQVSGNALVSDTALVSGNARVKRGEYNATPISITRSDGYTFTMQADGQSIVAGCRDFTLDQAQAHWGNPSHHKHAESAAILEALIAIYAARGAQ